MHGQLTTCICVHTKSRERKFVRQREREKERGHSTVDMQRHIEYRVGRDLPVCPLPLRLALTSFRLHYRAHFHAPGCSLAAPSVQQAYHSHDGWEPIPRYGMSVLVPY
eukprot:6585868-Pyramimonas_sp.AAC.1